MSREIKFRVYCIILNRTFIKTLNNLMNNPEQKCEIPVAYEYRGQYTGLKDKNGKEIYEGDIITTIYPWEGRCIVKFGEHEAEGQDYYSNTAYGWYYECLSNSDDTRALLYTQKDIEIIGNIYENPELLEK